jgi:hypothetical protein
MSDLVRETGWYWVITADGVARTAYYDRDDDLWTVAGGYDPLVHGRTFVISERFDRPPWVVPPVRRH